MALVMNLHAEGERRDIQPRDACGAQIMREWIEPSKGVIEYNSSPKTLDDMTASAQNVTE